MGKVAKASKKDGAKNEADEDMWADAPVIDIDADPENENWLRIVRQRRLKKEGHKIDPIYGIPVDRDLTKRKGDNDNANAHHNY